MKKILLTWCNVYGPLKEKFEAIINGNVQDMQMLYVVSRRTEWKKKKEHDEPNGRKKNVHVHILYMYTQIIRTEKKWQA